MIRTSICVNEKKHWVQNARGISMKSGIMQGSRAISQHDER